MPDQDKKWYYRQVLSVNKSAKEYDKNAVETADLPPVGKSPYCGIHENSTVKIELELQDIFGNRIGNKVPDLVVDVGYFDDIIGVSNWPGVNSTYEIVENGKIKLEFSFDTNQYLPPSDTSPDTNNNRPSEEKTYRAIKQLAKKHKQQYRKIYYQIIREEDINFKLQFIPESVGEIDIVDIYTSIEEFVENIYTYLVGVSEMEQVQKTIPDDAKNLDDLLPYDAKAIARENPDLKFKKSVNIDVPRYHFVIEDETLNDIGITEDLVKENENVPLNPGTTANVEKTYTFLNKLESIADAIYEEATAKGIILEENSNLSKLENMLETNKDKLLRPDLELTVNGITLTTDHDDTLASMLEKFGTGVTLKDIAAAKDFVIFKDNTVFTMEGTDNDNNPQVISYHYVTTLYSITTKEYCTLENLAEEAKETVLNEGIVLSVNRKELTVQEGNTLGDMVDRFKNEIEFDDDFNEDDITVAYIATENRFVEDIFPHNTQLDITNYVIQEGDLFKDITFENNKDIEDLFTAGTKLYVGTTPYTVRENDTLSSIALAELVELEDLAVRNKTKELAEQTLLMPEFTGEYPVIPESPAINGDIEIKTVDNIFPLSVGLVITRKDTLIDPDFKNTPDVKRSLSIVPPKKHYQGQDNAGELSLFAFADEFEKAYPGLKLAIGDRSKSEEKISSEKLLVVDFRNINDRGIKVEKSSTPLRFFALKPLANKLLSKTELEIKKYTIEVGLDDQYTEKLDFKSIDLDKWMREFLEAMDLILSPRYAVPLYKLSKSNTDTNFYSNIVKAKEAIAAFVADRVDVILERDKTLNVDEKDKAKEALKQRLLVELSRAYEIDSMIQIPFNVNSQYIEENTAPRFEGKLIDKNSKNKNYTFSTGKLPLKNGINSVEFMFDVKPEQEAEEEKFELDLEYQISGLEYMIENVDNNNGYQDSTWLSFIIPIKSGDPENVITDLGKTGIPVPLISYPSPPTLINQKGESYLTTNPIEDDDSMNIIIDKVKGWNYEFTYEDKAAAQDRIYLTVDFNTTDSFVDEQVGEDTNNKLFKSLAQFTYVYPELKKDLALLLTLKFENDNDGNKKIAIGALKAFNEIVNGITDEIDRIKQNNISRAFAGTTSELGKKSYDYKFEIEFNGTEKYIIKYKKKYDDDPLEFIYVRKKTSGKDIIWKETDKCIDEFQNEERVFTYPADLNPFDESLEYRFCFNNNDMIFIQNAWICVHETRNEELDFEDEGEPEPINTDFLYRTPKVHFLNKMTPQIRVKEIIDINNENNPQKIENALNDFFTALFTNEVQNQQSLKHRIKISCRYAYNVSGKDDSLITFVPILLIPDYIFILEKDLYKEGETTGFVYVLTEKLHNWEKENGPLPSGGAYYFDICTYSSIDPESVQPLLELCNVRYYSS